MGLAGKLNWLLAGDSVAEVAEVWIQKCSMRGYSHGEGEVLSHSCCIHGAMCMVILCYLQIHQRIHQKHPETGKSTGVVIFTWGEAHTASTQIGDLLPWGPGDRASHQNVGHWPPRRSTTNKTWAAIHHWQGIWVSWCWEFPKNSSLLSQFVAGYFGFLHQSMHPTATPWRLHGSVSRRSCVQMPSMQCGCFWFCRFHQIWNIFCDGLGLKIINHDNHDGLCLGKSWKIKLGEFVSTPARVCCGFCAPSSRRTMWFWCGPWQTVWDFGGKLPSFECQYQGETSDDEGSLFHLCQLHAGQIRAVFHLGGISSTGSFDLEDRMCSFPPVFSWRLLHMGPKRKAIDPPDGFVGSFFNVSDRLTAWEIPDTWRRPTARLPPKLWSAKGPFFLHRNFAVNQLVSGKIFTGNIQKHPETMFFSKPWFQASADPPEAFRVVRPSECQMISDDHKINPFYGNLESMDLKWLEYVGVYRWQPPQMWIGVDHGWRFFRLWLSIIFNSCGPCLRLGLHHSIKDNYMW